MLTLVYEMTDDDAVETFFGPEPSNKPLYEIAAENGAKIWEGELTWAPGGGSDDTLTLTEGTGVAEFAVLGRTVFAPKDLLILIVRRVEGDVDSLLS